MESASETLFKYKSLPMEHFSFRLLVIDPSSSLTDPLICSLVTESFDSVELYDCISYVWGEEPPSKPILLNGVEVLIRENL